MKLYIKEKVFSWGDKFTVKDAYGEDKYIVEGEVFSWGKKLHVYDKHGREVAFIKQEVWSFLPRYYVFCGERQVAEIKKEFTLLFPRYTIEGLGWEIDGSFMAHDYQITKNGRNIVTISKERMTWGDCRSCRRDRGSCCCYYHRLCNGVQFRCQGIQQLSNFRGKEGLDMKKSTSLIIGAALAAIAVCFVVYAAGHPEASFPWSNRISFMFYGAYIWLLLKFLIDIPFLSKKRRVQGHSNLVSSLGYFCMAIVFFLMEVTGDKVDVYTIFRGFIVVCAVDFGIENFIYECQTKI